MSVMELDMPAAPHLIPLPPCCSLSSNRKCTGRRHQGPGESWWKEAAESRFRTILFTRRCFPEILWKKWKKSLVFRTIPLGAILYHFAKNWICLPKSSTAIGSARVWSVVAVTLSFSLASSTSLSPPASIFLFYVDLSVSNLDGKFLTTVCYSV